MGTDSNGSGRGVGGKLKHAVEAKVLVPLATTIVSAAAAYLIKKLPLLLEEKVLPKLRESQAPEPVQKVVEQVAELGAAADGGDNAGGDDDGGEQETKAAGEQESQNGSSASQDDREREREAREERRAERRRALEQAS